MNIKIKDIVFSLIIFSLVPISQVMLFLSTVDRMVYIPHITSLQQSLNMSLNQVKVFEIFVVVIYSLLSFMIMYIVYLLSIKLSSKNNAQSLYISMILAIGMANVFGIIGNNLNLSFFGVSVFTSVVQIGVLTSFYGYNSKDYKGSAILGIMVILINIVIPFLIAI